MVYSAGGGGRSTNNSNKVMNESVMKSYVFAQSKDIRFHYAGRKVSWCFLSCRSGHCIFLYFFFATFKSLKSYFIISIYNCP